MRAFLTGGTGFIGLALTKRLLSDGVEVMSVAERAPPDWARRALGDAVAFATLDVCDRTALTHALRGWAPDVLIHGAAMTPDEARERSVGTAAIFEVNVAGTANALEAAAASGVGRVMAFSSGAAYGRTLDDTPVLDEATTDCRPVNLYGISKLAAERVALRLGALHGLSVVTPRLSAAWGPWEYPTVHRQTLSPPWQIIDAVMAGRVPRLPGNAALPLIFANDAADQLIRLIRARDAEGVFNVGSDRMITLADFAKAAGALGGLKPDAEARDITLFIAGRPPMSLDRLRAAIGPLQATDMTDALRQTFAWHRQTMPH